MVRVKYKPIKNNTILVTNDIILCNNRKVHATINVETLIYSIYETTNVLVKAQGKSLSDCKKRVKLDLKTLGASFDEEIRNRGKTKKLYE